MLVSDSTYLGGLVYDSATVNVAVMDVNDNAPKFTYEEWTFSVLENGPVNQTIGKVTAADPDLDLAGHINFSIIGSGESLLNI